MKSVIVLIVLLLFSLVLLEVEFNKGTTVSASHSGTGIISPAKGSSTQNPVTLNVITGGLGGSNIFYSMSYSLDGKENVSIPVKIQSYNNSFQVGVTGLTILPILPDGLHIVTVYTLEQWQTNPPHAFWSSNEVDFTINDLGAQIYSPTAYPTNNSTPTVPEFPTLTILPLLLSMFCIAVAIRHRKTINLNKATS
jgi:hypothetical protein